MRRSSGSKSLTVVPRSSVPGVTIAPAAASRASARLVLPAAGRADERERADRFDAGARA